MSAYLEPLVDTLGMELVLTGQHAQHLPQLEVTHTNNARRLLRVALFTGIPEHQE